MANLLEEQYRKHFVKLTTSMVSYFGMKELELAEDIVQDTFETAAKEWNTKPPEDPEAWLFKVCKHKALNYLKKQQNRAQLNSFYERGLDVDYRLEVALSESEIKDSKLRLMFALSHPKLSAKTSLTLVLRTLMGFSIKEISRGLGISESAVKKILVRGKQQIREEGIPLRVPYLLQSKSRLTNVHKVIYLIFSEGINASSGVDNIKQELCLEAYVLINNLIEEGISDTNTFALMALMLFNLARIPARQSKAGELIDLENQNRELWDAKLIQSGYHYLNLSRGEVLSSYHLEAGIASLHCNAPTFDQTNWPQILNFYDHLVKLNDSPFVRMNRVIAVIYINGPEEALKELITLEGEKALAEYYLFHITKGKLYLRLNNVKEAVECFREGLSRTKVLSEKQYIQALIASVE